MPDVLFPRYGDTDPWILVSINGIDHSFRAGEVVTVSDAVLAALDESHYAYDEHGGIRYPGYELGGGDPGSPMYWTDADGNRWTDADGNPFILAEEE